MNVFTKTTTFILIFFLSMSFNAFAQNGMYDVRFNINAVDCENNKILVDIDVRANSSTTTFNLTDQNFRFSYSREAVELGSVEIANQNLVGFVPPFSFYDPHTLTGSIDTVVSYNVILAGGDGVLITTDWLTIGTISFTILDASQCLELKWHDHAPENFPPTFIGEKVNGVLYAVNEGNYYNTSVCPNDCLPALPIELSSFTAQENNCQVNLEWTTASEINNAYFVVEKSEDGRVFEAMGTVEAVGNSNNTTYYSFKDEVVTDFSYYRLTQVDLDGTSTSSDIVSVKSSCTFSDVENEISSVYPNPVSNGNVRVVFNASSAHPDAMITITDVLGRPVASYPLPIEAGSNFYSFSADNLAEGSYVVKIFDDSWSIPAQSFIKINR